MRAGRREGAAWKRLSLVVLLASWACADERSGVHWPSFRGPQASGVAEDFRTPTRWNAETPKNIAWKTPIPGLGHSGPVIWGGRVFVTTAISDEEDPELRVGLYGDVQPVSEQPRHRWQVLCLDKHTGKILWERTAHTGVPKTKRHPKSTHANPTPATDGKHVVAFFGSEGLYCHDVDGKLLWQKDLGVLDAAWFVAPEAQWGFGSSPIIFDGKVIVQCDVLGDSFIAAFDVSSGRELWRTPRDEVPTWSTPTVHRGADRTQVIANGYKHIGGYDLATGKELWRLRDSGGDIPVPTPIVAHDLIFITSAHGGQSPIFAVPVSAMGEVAVPGGDSAGGGWVAQRAGNYMQTPLVYGEYLYCCSDNGILRCYDPKTGERVYRKRLGSGRTGFTASPVAADGKLYFASERGDVYVVKAGPAFEQLAVNPTGEICMATPAVSEGMLFFRTRHHLVAVVSGAAGTEDEGAAEPADG
jgi:outer membrane protein assembly factor BamB